MERLELARRLGAGSRRAGGHAIIVEERDPGRFMAVFSEVVADSGTVLVMDPTWRAVERDQFAVLAQSQIGDGESKSENQKPEIEHGWLCLPTGGSSGSVRLARHDQDTLAAAVRGFGAHFKIDRINAVGVLPLHHVSGLMAWVRCALTGGRYVPWVWADMEAGRWPVMGHGDWVLSLVPTQLQRLLDQPGAAERLRRFRAVFVGGGPAWPDLLERAAEAQLPLSPGYGMTETAAMVTASRPEEFLAGRRGCGSALPHARVELGADGGIAIAAESLFRGYYPQWRQPGAWATEDQGRFDESGSLHVIGRRDAVIISGGEKIDPGEVEAVLRMTGQFSDVAVIGLPDAEWGEMVVACYSAGPKEPDAGAVDRKIADYLAPHKRPRHYVSVASWPRNDQGKVNRRALAALSREQIARAQAE
jgi:O-succinylbenzoic acid--CoA ligase